MVPKVFKPLKFYCIYGKKKSWDLQISIEGGGGGVV